MRDYKFIAELNVWAKRLIDASGVNKSYSNIAVPIDESIWKLSATILDLLFNYTYKSVNFYLYYKEADWMNYADKNVKNRLIVLRGKSLLYVADTDSMPANNIFAPDPYNTNVVPNPINSVSNNVFQITRGELWIMKLLQKYKNTGTCNIDSIIYDDLPSSLSKLMYLYLYIELTNDYSKYNDKLLVNSSDRLLVSLYEKFIIDHYYKKASFSYASSLGKDYFSSNKSNSKIVILSMSDIAHKYWDFPAGTELADSRSIFVVHDSNTQVYDIDYEVIVDPVTHNCRLSWDGKQLQNKINTYKNVLYVMWAYRQ